MFCSEQLVLYNQIVNYYQNGARPAFWQAWLYHQSLRSGYGVRLTAARVENNGKRRFYQAVSGLATLVVYGLH
jgi:hypothetical protein